MNWDQQLIKACTETDGTPHPHIEHKDVTKRMKENND